MVFLSFRLLTSKSSLFQRKARVLSILMLCLLMYVILLNILVNRVLDRMFSGQFSLNVHTATIGDHVPIQHPTWPEPQPYANLQSHKGRYTVVYTVTPHNN